MRRSGRSREEPPPGYRFRSLRRRPVLERLEERSLLAGGGLGDDPLALALVQRSCADEAAVSSPAALPGLLALLDSSSEDGSAPANEPVGPERLKGAPEVLAEDELATAGVSPIKAQMFPSEGGPTVPPGGPPSEQLPPDPSQPPPVSSTPTTPPSTWEQPPGPTEDFTPAPPSPPSPRVEPALPPAVSSDGQETTWSDTAELLSALPLVGSLGVQTTDEPGAAQDWSELWTVSSLPIVAESTLCESLAAMELLFGFVWDATPSSWDFAGFTFFECQGAEPFTELARPLAAMGNFEPALATAVWSEFGPTVPEAQNLGGSQEFPSGAAAAAGVAVPEGPAPRAAGEGLAARAFISRAAVNWLAGEGGRHKGLTALKGSGAGPSREPSVSAVGRVVGALAAPPRAFAPVEEAAWEEFAAGSRTALMQAAGTGGRGGGAEQLVEEGRAPWELLFAPALFTFGVPRRYQATILLIEHDEPTRDAFHVLLAEQGYLVLAAGTAHDAWGVLRAPLAPIDLVLLDAHLPDVSGMMLYARMRELYPELPVVICSRGELDPDELAGFRDLGAPHYLRKPVAEEKLLATVQAVLN